MQTKKLKAKKTKAGQKRMKQHSYDNSDRITWVQLITWSGCDEALYASKLGKAILRQATKRILHYFFAALLLSPHFFTFFRKPFFYFSKQVLQI